MLSMKILPSPPSQWKVERLDRFMAPPSSQSFFAHMHSELSSTFQKKLPRILRMHEGREREKKIVSSLLLSLSPGKTLFKGAILPQSLSTFATREEEAEKKAKQSGEMTGKNVLGQSLSLSLSLL